MSKSQTIHRKKIGILRFPGTNCDRDIWGAVETVTDYQPEWLWHADHFDPLGYEALILPGGFSYGDYLRSGALAARARVMQSLRAAVQKGVPVLGICNGFQILVESGLLPGALVRNLSLRFCDTWVDVKVQSAKTSPWTKGSLQKGDISHLPIAHADGRYFVTEDEYKRLQDQDQIWLTYIQNPNGSVGDIAGVQCPKGQVVGLMPHPERAIASWMGSECGRSFFALGL